MTISEWLNKNKKQDNIFAPAMDAQTCINFLKDYLLDEDWRPINATNINQVNAQIVNDILMKYKRKKYKKKDKELYSLEPQDLIRYLTNYLLGENWYSVNPISTEQINTEIIFEILSKYSSKYNSEVSLNKKHDNFGILILLFILVVSLYIVFFRG